MAFTNMDRKNSDYLGGLEKRLGELRYASCPMLDKPLPRVRIKSLAFYFMWTIENTKKSPRADQLKKSLLIKLLF